MLGGKSGTETPGSILSTALGPSNKLGNGFDFGSQMESAAPSLNSWSASMQEPMHFKNIESSQKDNGAQSRLQIFCHEEFESSQKDNESSAPSCYSLHRSRKLWEDLNPPVDDSSPSTWLDEYEEVEYQMVSAEERLKSSYREELTGWGDVCEPEIKLEFSYTDVMMTGEAQEMPEEHMVRLIKQEKNLMSSLDQILKREPGRGKPSRTVVTQGVAGNGKTFSVKKFIHNWVEGKTNTDVNFVLSFSFRELNLIRRQKSLHQLVTDFHPALRGVTEPNHLDSAKVIIILDGLDESRLLLDFDATAKISSVSKVTSLSKLVVNLIKGSLLPDAQLWITTRSVVSHQIPSKYVDVLTDIRGFSHSQKDEYFRRKFSSDPDSAEGILSHVQSSVAFSDMCQSPLFCSISALLYEQKSGGFWDPESAHTITELMAHFLIAQNRLRWRKYGWGRHQQNPEETHRDFLLRLCKLAFVQLEENRLIFDESDLDQCGIDLTEAIIFSGFCSGILRGKDVFSERKVFFFVHAMIQEFFAALYVFDCFMSCSTEELGNSLHLSNKEHTPFDLLKFTVEKVLEKRSAQSDFFLRFLLGLLVDSNQRILKDIIGSPDQSPGLVTQMQMYLKAIQGNVPPHLSYTLSRCLVDMRDRKGRDDVEDRRDNETGPNPSCSAVSFNARMIVGH